MRLYLFSVFILLSSFTLVDDTNSCPMEAIEFSSEDMALMELYRSIDGNMPAQDIFFHCLKGYSSLGNQLSTRRDKQIITIIDYRLSSNKERLWVIDLNRNKVLFHSLVAHGKNTGNEFARKFSNTSGSHQSSLGFYITAKTYTGKHGTSLYLEGAEEDINDNAMERYIVMHGAEYVSHDFIKKHGRLGRSFGCPSVPMSNYKEIINTIKEGTCLFMFYPDKEYLSSSKVLDRVS